MNISEKIAYVKTVPNMVQVEGLLASITADYMTRYANEVERAPAAHYGTQSAWISKAIRFFIADIHRDKLAIWNNIPDRFKGCTIYQRLAVSQFVTSK